MAQPLAYDVVILGAGGAGLMCALHAGRRGRRVLVLDHAEKAGGKILISGGGRCNFTNLGASPANFVSRDPAFCESALARYPAREFIELVKAHRIPFHEKKLGQLFCDRSARDIVKMLLDECERAKVTLRLGVKISGVSASPDGPARFNVETAQGSFAAASVVVATGGLSIPQIGATGLGYQIAQQFGLRIVPRHPALDGFLFSDAELPFFAALSGVSVDCTMTAGGKSFRENLLFTHKGLSGPAALQASLHWNIGEPVTVDLLPDQAAAPWLAQRKRQGERQAIKNLLAEKLPARFAEAFAALHFSPKQTLFDAPAPALEAFTAALNAWTLRPKSTIGYNKAEVTRGGVSTQELSPETLEAKRVPGLYFVGEVVDVTGWLGGYNFQWAWSSGWAAAQAV